MIIEQKQAIELLKQGQVIGIPTDTVYGFAVLKPYAKKIYDLKQRDPNKKLISFVPTNHYFAVDDYTKAQFEKYWPGNYTFIIKQNDELVSYRIPNEPNTLALLNQLNDILLTTSANISGHPPINNQAEFLKTFPQIPLLKEKIISKKSNMPSKIYIIDNKEMTRIR